MNKSHLYVVDLLLGLVLLTGLYGCVSKDVRPEENLVELNIMNTTSNSVDLDLINQDITKRVTSVLPNAYPSGLILSGRCDDIPRLAGNVVFTFVQEDPKLFGRDITYATVVVNTTNETAKIRYENVTRFYPSARRTPFPENRALNEAITQTSAYIKQLGISDCEITMTQLEDGWEVRCGPLHDFTSKCSFQIRNGKISARDK